MSMPDETARGFEAKSEQQESVGLGHRLGNALWNFPTEITSRAIHGLLLWQRRLETRDQLQSMGDDRLKDIGMTHEIRDREVAKPFWRD